jgi:selT/selW/selH-like putative selenoprotein
VSLKESIEREFPVPVRLRAGAPGALDVFVDGERVYSKKQAGRLPTSGEVLTLIRDKLSRA